MLEQVLQELHNWFPAPDGVHHGTFTVAGGRLALPFVRCGQYFRIVGSVFSDGLYRYGPDLPALEDETFTGAIWALAVPKAVVDLAGEIAAWEKKDADIRMGPYAAESKADYSYSKAVDPRTGGAVTWQSAFRPRLNPYRKLGGTG